MVHDVAVFFVRPLITINLQNISIYKLQKSFLVAFTPGIKIELFQSCFSHLLATYTQSNSFRSILECTISFVSEAAVHNCSMEIAIMRFSEYSLKNIYSEELFNQSCKLSARKCIIKGLHHSSCFRLIFLKFLEEFFYRKLQAFATNDNFFLHEIYFTQIVSRLKTSTVSKVALRKHLILIKNSSISRLFIFKRVFVLHFNKTLKKH